MPVINVLDKHVAELIAAGEVVERPASAIKELMENSIDAGASSITVEIKNGGISYIRITDDGCGIERADVRNAFLRHATSKIKSEEDLESIGTLGFRGEALASIAAVSKVEMLTKTQEETVGSRITLSGGEVESLDDAGCPKGTTIIVRDIFFNTPARMKFLKKDVSEGNAVANVVEKTALSHPNVSIRFLRDNQERLYTPGDNSLKSTIYAVYGKKFSDDLIPVNFTSGALTLQGYITKPYAARANRTMQNFFVNERFVKSKTCMVALEEGYKHSIMVGKFPACVLHITIPENTVDVNVHPAKIEVRFANEKMIFDLVYYGVKSAIMKSGDQPELHVPPTGQTVSIVKATEQIDAVKNQVHFDEIKPSSRKSTLVERENPVPPKAAAYRPQMIFTSPEREKLRPLQDITTFTYELKPKAAIPVDETTSPSLRPIQADQQEETEKNVKEISGSANRMQKEEDGYRLVGEVFRTYMILEQGEKVVFIDKHAAHERLLYNRLKTGLGEMDRQFLLSPVMVTLTPPEHEAVCGNVKAYAALGFDVEDFGDHTILVRSAPMMLDTAEIENCVCEIATSILEHKKDLTPQAMDDLYHSMACKAAMKANDKRNTLELEQLITLLRQDDDAKYCPHGRPVSIVIKKTELEKKFGRLG